MVDLKLVVMNLAVVMVCYASLFVGCAMEVRWCI